MICANPRSDRTGAPSRTVCPLPLSALLRPFLAEAEKRHFGVARRAAGPGAPFRLDHMHVPARGGSAGHVVDLRIERRNIGDLRAVFPDRAAAVGDELVLLVVDADLVIRHVVVLGVFLGDGQDQAAELTQGGARSTFLLQHRHGDTPFLLAATMFARQLVDAALQRFAQAEIFARQRQHLLRADRVEDPVAELDLDLLHAPVAGFAHDPGAFDQAEGLEDLLAPGGDVGRDARARQPLHRRLQEVVAAPGGHAVGRLEQIGGVKADHLLRFLALVHALDEAGDAVDQHVAVMHRGQPVDRWFDVDGDTLVLVAARPRVRFGAEREDRTRHRAHVALGGRIEDVADEEIPLRMAVRQQWIGGWPGGHGKLLNDTSHTQHRTTTFHTRQDQNDTSHTTRATLHTRSSRKNRVATGGYPQGFGRLTRLIRESPLYTR